MKKLTERSLISPNSGITLIALVITIIVLLILAGISLNLISGSDGILGKASTAVDKTKHGSAEEELGLAVVEVKIGYYENHNGTSLRDYLIENLNGFQTPNGNIACDSEGKVIYTGTNGTITGTINEEGELKIEQKGIVISPTTLNLKREEGKDAPTAHLTANLIGITGAITWISSDTNVVTISGNGTTATVTAVTQGTATITASCAGYTANCDVQIIEPIDIEKIIGEFVHYEVPYTDVYHNEFQYTADNGWRIMNIEKQENDTYDLQLISTGIPAGLYYDWGSIKNFEKDEAGTIGKWAANAEQRQSYENNFCTSGSIDNENMYMVAGLYNNFEKIILKGTDNSNVGYNYGYFTKIKGETPSETTTGAIFRAEEMMSKITGIRTLMLTEVVGKNEQVVTFTDKAIGLFRLIDLVNMEDSERHQVSQKKYSNGLYWFASPYSNNSSDVFYMYCEGQIYIHNLGYNYGLRPVISLTGIELNQDTNTKVWQMK